MGGNMPDYSGLGIVYKDKPPTSTPPSSQDDYSGLGIVYKDKVPASMPSAPLTLSGIGNDIGSGINAVGGTLGKGIIDAISGLVDAPIVAGDYINRKLASALGYDPNKLPTPGVINPAYYSMPGVSAQAQQILNPIAETGASAALLAAPARDIVLTGIGIGKILASPLLGKNVEKATQKFLDVANDTYHGLLGNSLSTPSQQLEQGTRNVLSQLYPDASLAPPQELANNAESALQNMYGTSDYKNLIGKENTILSQKVKDAYDTNYQIGSDRFEKTLANNNPIISPEDSFINKSEGEDLTKLMNMDPLLSGKIIDAGQSPTLRNLHDVQSKMGSMIADIKSVPYAERDNNALNLLTDYRDKIINNISTYAPEYKDDQAFWKNNVVPYQNNTAINNLVNNRIVPANIGNILSKPELADVPNRVPGTVNTVLRHLTPQDKQLIPLSKLSGSQ
jgi:hypothetical protein